MSFQGADAGMFIKSIAKTPGTAIIKNRFLGYDGEYPADGDAAYGVSMNGCSISANSIAVELSQQVMIEIQETVNVGDKLTPGTNGKARVAGFGDEIRAISLETKTYVPGEFTTVLCILLYMQVDSGQISRTIKSELINFDDASPVTALVIPAGAIVEKVYCKIETGFDGTGATIDIGDNADDSGFMENTNITQNTPGEYGLPDDKGGTLLWSSGNLNPFYAAPNAVKVKIGAGSPASTTGSLYVYMKYSLIG